MKRLAGWCFVRRRVVLAGWLVGLVVSTALMLSIGSSYTGDFDLPKSEAQRAQALLKRDFPQQAAASNTIVVEARKGRVTDPSAVERIEPVFAEIRSMPRVEFLASFYSEGNLNQISADGKIAYATLQIQIPKSGTPTDEVRKIMDVAERIESDELRVEFGGQAIQDTIEPVPGISESLGVIAAGVVLFVAFGSLVTMSLPLLTASIAVGISVTLVGILSHVMTLPSFAPALAGLLGLGVGIDYALLIVNRHQRNLIEGRSPEQSLAVASMTSGRAVVFAGVIVCVGLVGLVTLGIGFVTGLALAGAVAVLLTMLATVTLLPAMLGFLGDKALPKRRRGRAVAAALGSADASMDGSGVEKSGWYVWAKRIERRPRAWMAAALAVMVLLSVPFLSMRLGASDEGNDPTTATTRQAYDLLARGFGPGTNGPLLLVMPFEVPSDFNTFTNFVDELSDTPGIRSIDQPMTSSNGRSGVVLVYPTTSPQSEETSDLIDRLRDDEIPSAAERYGVSVYVGGQTASYDDFGRVVMGKLPLFMAAVLLVSFALLTVVFRSVVIPLKATLMNLLTTSAAFGAVVAVFQWGWGGELLGGGQGPIESFVPVILFAIVFGLSMDYEVFLVSRMREEWERTGDNSEAVALGQAQTGRLITAAAAVMVLIFVSFLFGPDRVIKLFGLGLAVAILLDAMVVRAVLVPAVMHVFGTWNWWLPPWLDKRLPKLSVEEQSPTT